MTMLRSLAAAAALTLGAMLLPASLQAQEAVSGPRVASAGVTHVVESNALLPEATLLQQQGTSQGQNVAMMIVGGAAIVVGSVVGGDGGQIITITGAVIGLIGLFRYLR